jgi:hypothetical protein
MHCAVKLGDCEVSGMCGTQGGICRCLVGKFMEKPFLRSRNRNSNDNGVEVVNFATYKNLIVEV